MQPVGFGLTRGKGVGRGGAFEIRRSQDEDLGRKAVRLRDSTGDPRCE